MVLALKNGVPTLAINSVPAGAKVWRQAKTIGWPVVFNANTLTDEALQEAFDYCLTEEARAKARECCGRAVKEVQEVGGKFLAALTHSGETAED
jgi:UDP:flavonoid glycosyltransferase YjiC (YdhE family)